MMMLKTSYNNSNDSNGNNNDSSNSNNDNGDNSGDNNDSSNSNNDNGDNSGNNNDSSNSNNDNDDNSGNSNNNNEVFCQEFCDLGSPSQREGQWEWYRMVEVVEVNGAPRVRTSCEPVAEGIFPLELAWVLTPFFNALSDESVNPGLVCAHMHSIVRTQKILSFMS